MPTTTLDPPRARTRTVTAIVATDAPVQVYDARSGRVVLESLHLLGVQAAEDVPVLVDHDRSMRSLVGRAGEASIEGGKLLAKLSIAAGTPAADETWALIDQKAARSVSVGYTILESVELRPGESRTIGAKVYTAPSGQTLRVVTRWLWREVSVVPIGADSGAVIRSFPFEATRSHPMPATTTRPRITDLLGRQAIGMMTWTELAAAALRERGEDLPENDLDTCRAAFSGVDGVSDLITFVTANILDGWRSCPDTSAGWVRAVPLQNYLAAKLATLTTQPRLERLSRGQVAPAAAWSAQGESIRLCKFGMQVVIDDQDMVDASRLAVYQTAMAGIGATVRQLVLDMIYVTILQNPTLVDTIALFDAAGRSNYGSGGGSVLGATSVDTAMAAIAGQVGDDVDGDPVHLGYNGRYLIVPPALAGLARRTARNMALADGSDLVVRTESRLGATGTVDPLTDTIVQGSDTCWMLAAPESQAASIVLGLLNGKSEPTIRSFTLDQGQWGVGFDISFSCAVSAVDGKPLYFSAGA